MEAKPPKPPMKPPPSSIPIRPAPSRPPARPPKKPRRAGAGCCMPGPGAPGCAAVGRSVAERCIGAAVLGAVLVVAGASKVRVPRLPKLLLLPARASADVAKRVRAAARTTSIRPRRDLLIWVITCFCDDLPERFPGLHGPLYRALAH